jgi:hypothetical protein
MSASFLRTFEIMMGEEDTHCTTGGGFVRSLAVDFEVNAIGGRRLDLEGSYLVEMLADPGATILTRYADLRSGGRNLCSGDHWTALRCR